MLILSFICMMAFSTANSAYSSSGSGSSSRVPSRYGYTNTNYAPTYGYTGGYAGGTGGFASAGGFAGVGGFDPFAFVFGHQNAVNQQIANTFYNNQLFHDQLTASILAQNAYLANLANSGNRYGSGYRRPSGSGYATFAGGAVSAGPNGVHHTTFVYPPNAHSTNVDTRVGGVPHRGSGYYGISSGSFSSNLDGKHHGGSITAVNNNGKVTVYRTHS